MKELKVGERVTITLEVVEELSCYGCFFRTSFGKCNGDGKVKCSLKSVLLTMKETKQRVKQRRISNEQS